MRRALIIGRKQGETDFTTLVQPTDPQSANSAYKALLHAPGDIAEMQLWESDAIAKRKTFPGLTGSPVTSSNVGIGPDASESSSAPESEPQAEAADEPDDDADPSLLPRPSKKK